MVITAEQIEQKTEKKPSPLHIFLFETLLVLLELLDLSTALLEYLEH